MVRYPPEHDRVTADRGRLLAHAADHEPRPLLVEAVGLFHLDDRHVDVRSRRCAAREYFDGLHGPRANSMRRIIEGREVDERAAAPKKGAAEDR
jgi:hypothetical protein